MNFFSDQIWGGGAVAAASAPIVSTPLPAVASPSVLGNFWSAFSSPFTELAKGAPTIAGAVGQSLNTILLSKAGLIPKPQQQGTGTVVYYEKPTAGITPATSINIAQPAASGQANQGIQQANQGIQQAGILSSFGSSSTLIIIIIIAVLLIGLLMGRR